MTKRDPEQYADVLPINCPSRAELWRRLRLATALLGHRPCTEQLKADLLAVLDGKMPKAG